MAKDGSRCHRCAGPLDDTGRSWIYAKKDKPPAIISMCGACSAVPIDTCLMCKVNPALADQPLCDACEKAV